MRSKVVGRAGIMIGHRMLEANPGKGHRLPAGCSAYSDSVLFPLEERT